MNLNKHLFILMAFLLTSMAIHAQIDYRKYDWDTAQYYKIQLKGSKEYKGFYVSHDSTAMKLRTKSGSFVVIRFEKIRGVEELARPSEVVYAADPGRAGGNGPNPRDIDWEMGAHQTRYLFAPSAIMLKKKTGYYQNTWVMANSVNYGLTDHISIGGTMDLVSLVAMPISGQSPFFFITPKFGFQPGKKMFVAGGLFAAVLPGAGAAIIPYGVGTYGNSEYNGTIGIGWGMGTEYVSPSPIFTACGMARISRRTALVTENWFVPEESGKYMTVNSFGFRVYNKMAAIDMAAVLIPKFVPFPIPFLSFTLKF